MSSDVELEALRHKRQPRQKRRLHPHSQQRPPYALHRAQRQPRRRLHRLPPQRDPQDPPQSRQSRTQAPTNFRPRPKPRRIVPSTQLFGQICDRTSITSPALVIMGPRRRGLICVSETLLERAFAQQKMKSILDVLRLTSKTEAPRYTERRRRFRCT